MGCYLRRAAPDTNKQKPQSGFCEGVIRREATEIEGLVYIQYPDKSIRPPKKIPLKIVHK